MIKLISNSPKATLVSKPMCEMRPLEVCVILAGEYEGSVVMRTASLVKFEVMNITKCSQSACWIEPSSDIQVRPLRDGESYTLELS